MKISIQLTSGKTTEITGQKFTKEVQGRSFDFFVHKSLSTNGYDVSEVSSGKRVLQIPVIETTWQNKINAAKKELDKLIDRIGEARVRSVFEGA